MKALFVRHRVSRAGFLKPYKRLMPDVIVSEAMVDAGVALANDLYRAFEGRGYRVMMAPSGHTLQRCAVEQREKPPKETRRNDYESNDIWWTERPTLAYVGEVAFGITIFETSENVEMIYLNGDYVPTSTIAPDRLVRLRAQSHHWTTRKDRPSGRLTIQVYSPYQGVSWKRTWTDVGQGSSTAFGAIVDTLVAAVPTINELRKQADEKARQRAIEWEESKARWAREEAARQRAAKLAASTQALNEIIAAWSKARGIAAFLDAAAAQAMDLSEADRAALESKIASARQILGSYDVAKALIAWTPPPE